MIFVECSGHPEKGAIMADELQTAKQKLILACYNIITDQKTDNAGLVILDGQIYAASAPSIKNIGVEGSCAFMGFYKVKSNDK